MAELVERMKGAKIIKPIIYGNTAAPFGYKRESDGHTHKWTCFVRPYNQEDASKWIRKVHFKLHDSYANNNRIVESPPFEVSETGWGEFEIQIRIFFADNNEKSVTAFHYLRLFQPVFNLPNGETQVVAELYDELVFQEPTIPMYKLLTAEENRKPDIKSLKNDIPQILRRTVEMAETAQEEIRAEINDLRDSLKRAHDCIMKYKEESQTDGNSETANSTPNPYNM